MKKLIAIIFCVIVNCQLLIVNCLGESGVAHPNPHDLAVPFEGEPWYVVLEPLGTMGGPVADFGSHFGVKAYLDTFHFCKLGNYLCLTDMFASHEIDYSSIYLTSEGNIYFNPARERKIHFHYWGWTETSESDGISAISRVFFIDTDTLLVWTRFTNTGQQFLEVNPQLCFALPPKSARGEGEGSRGRGTNFEMEWLEGEQVVLLDNKDSFRAIVTFPPIRELAENTISAESVKIQPREQFDFWYVTGFSAPPEEQTLAIKRAKDGLAKIGGEPEKVFKAIQEDWDNFLYKSCPHPCTEQDAYKRLYWLAACGLRMGIYAPRGAMEYPCSVPCKTHYNYFWGWDTAFQVLGHSEWDPGLAEENLWTQFWALGADGMLRTCVDDQAQPQVNLIDSQPPAQGWSIYEICERDSNSQRREKFITAMGPKMEANLKWWKEARDATEDGLFEFASGSESGWDDTPRFSSGRGKPGQTTTNAVDINCWIFRCYRTAAYLARELAKPQVAARWTDQAKELGKLIDERLWSNEDGCWLDYDTRNESFVKVLTPVIWWPLFMATTTDIDKVRSVIEKHLLNPDEFFGKYPIPTVAYNSPKFNSKGDGLYWRGQNWLITAYAAVVSLYRYGYEQQAEELFRRQLDLMKDKGGLYETYDVLHGEVGWKQVVGNPSCFQFGWSCALTMELLLRRYQRERYLLTDGKECFKAKGFIKNLVTFPDEKIFYTVDTDEYNVPLLDFKSLDGKPLKEGNKISLTITDPYHNLLNREAKVALPLLRKFRVSQDGEEVKLLDARSFLATLGKEYIILVE